MGLDPGLEELLKDVLHFVEFTLKDQLLPLNIVEEKFRISGRIASVLQKKHTRNVPKCSAPAENDSYIVMGSPRSLQLEDEAILRSGHKHRNGIIIEASNPDFRSSESDDKLSDSGCPDSFSQFSDEISDSKRVSLSSTSSAESSGGRRQDDTVSLRSAVSSVRSPSFFDAVIPSYDEVEARSVYNGPIKRKAGIVPGWKTYAGAIWESKLLLYCSSKTGGPKLAIALDSYEVRAASVSKKKNNFEFVIVGAGKQTYKFRTESEDDLSSWVRSLEYVMRSLSDSVQLSGATEGESNDSLMNDDTISTTDTVGRSSRLSDYQPSLGEKFDLISDMKKIEEYENLKKLRNFEQSMTELEQIKEECPKSPDFENRGLPSIPVGENLYDDIGSHGDDCDENIYDMPSRGRRKEELYDMPANFEDSRRSSAGTLYDSPDDVVYDAPNVSFFPTEVYDVPKISYPDTPPTPESPQVLVLNPTRTCVKDPVSTVPALSAKKRSPQRSECVREAYYNVPRNVFEPQVYDQPKQIPPRAASEDRSMPKLQPRVSSEEKSKPIPEPSSQFDSKSKIPRKLSFTTASVFKDELEMKLQRSSQKKRGGDSPSALDKNKRDFMSNLLGEVPTDGQFYAMPALVEPEQLDTPVPAKRLTKQSTVLADVFASARNVFAQKMDQSAKSSFRSNLSQRSTQSHESTELKPEPVVLENNILESNQSGDDVVKSNQSKSNPRKLRLELENIPDSMRINPEEIRQRSAPSTPTRVAPPRPPAPLSRIEEIKEKVVFQKQNKSPPPPLCPPSDEIYEDISAPEYSEPEIYSARWAYISSSDKELNLRKGEIVYVISKVNKELWFCKTAKNQGYVPPGYLARTT